jgi:hypothetical protein|tara:strand:- start:584 stop:706 length:123 start_codon:yes stop_codon:yes gene_type:complete
MCGELKGSYVAEFKINQGHIILKNVIKINILLQNFDQLRS